MKNLSFCVTFAVSVTVLLLLVSFVLGEECDQEEFAKCAEPLDMLQLTPDFSIGVSKKGELDKLCHKLRKGLRCIQSYTRRCMDLEQRNQFNKLYHGTNQFIRDLCNKGEFQEEYLQHAPCTELAKKEFEECSDKHKDTMVFINPSKNNEQSENITMAENVKTICCSINELVDCSEKAAKKICGNNAAKFTRELVKKFSATLTKLYCDNFVRHPELCHDGESKGSTIINNNKIFSSIIIMIITKLNIKLNVISINCLSASLLLAIIQISSGYQISPRISNGHNAIPHSAPYIISLQVKDGDKTRHSCGGAILNENWIITAGHCLNDFTNSAIFEMLIQAGRHNIQLQKEPTAQTRKVHWYKIHEKYGGDVGPNDLALIYVKEPFIWSETVQPILLPKSNKKDSGIGTLFGWGLLPNNVFASILQTADMPILPIKQCIHDFPDYAKYLELTNICTYASNGVGICSSDSGGPLVQMNDEDKMEIIGIVSWGPAICGKPNKRVSVYVRVSSFIDWIENVQKEFVEQ